MLVTIVLFILFFMTGLLYGVQMMVRYFRKCFASYYGDKDADDRMDDIIHALNNSVERMDKKETIKVLRYIFMV